MTLEYLEVKDIAKQKNWKVKKLIQYCLAADIRIFALVIAKHLGKQKLSEIATEFETEKVFIDHKYLAIPPTALKDFIGLSKGDGRSATIPFLIDLEIKNTLFLPLDKEGKDGPCKFSEFKLYLSAIDVKTLDNYISANESTPDDKDIDNQIVVEEDVALGTSQDGDNRFSQEMQNIANDLAAKYMKDHNGKIPHKNTITNMMSEMHPRLGTQETIARRIKKTWGSIKHPKYRTSA